jgi:hypothetical protein
MPLSARCFLIDIYPQLRAAFGAFHALAINNRRAGLAVAPFALPNDFHQGGIELFPVTGLTPAPEVRIHRLPRRKFVGQQPPGTTRLHQIKERVQDFPHRPDTRAAFAGLRQQWRNYIPFSIIQVRRVRRRRVGLREACP